jgi:hypothetical protein
VLTRAASPPWGRGWKKNSQSPVRLRKKRKPRQQNAEAVLLGERLGVASLPAHLPRKRCESFSRSGPPRADCGASQNEVPPLTGQEGGAPEGGSRGESVIPPEPQNAGSASLVPARRLHLSEVPPTTMEKAKPAENKRCHGLGMGSRRGLQLTRHSAVFA